MSFRASLAELPEPVPGPGDHFVVVVLESAKERRVIGSQDARKGPGGCAANVRVMTGLGSGGKFLGASKVLGARDGFEDRPGRAEGRVFRGPHRAIVTAPRARRDGAQLQDTAHESSDR